MKLSRTFLALSCVLTLAACKSEPQTTATATEPVASSTTAEKTPAEAPGGDGEQAQGQESQATVVAEAEATRRLAPNGKAEIVELARGENAFLGKLSVEPGAGVPKHRDPTEEYIYVLEGHGTMYIDGQSYEVGPGSAIYMPAGAEVSFENGDEKLVAVQVFAGPQPAEKYDAWKPQGQ